MSKKNGHGKVAQLPTQPQQSGQVSPEVAKMVNDILSDKAKAPNEFVQYLADEIRGSRAEMAVLSEQLNQHRNAVQNLERATLQLQGAHNKYMEDIARWVEKAIKATSTPPPPRPIGAPPEAPAAS